MDIRKGFCQIRKLMRLVQYPLSFATSLSHVTCLRRLKFSRKE
jgi:hypothetical protein